MLYVHAGMKQHLKTTAQLHEMKILQPMLCKQSKRATATPFHCQISYWPPTDFTGRQVTTDNYGKEETDTERTASQGQGQDYNIRVSFPVACTAHENKLPHITELHPSSSSDYPCLRTGKAELKQREEGNHIASGWV